MSQPSQSSASSTPPPPKSLRRNKNDQKWEAHKNEIYELYINESKTLPETMRLMEQRHGFKASLRKWKDKTRNEWHFEKNIASKDMQVLLAKAEKRAREEGKQTVFYHAGSQMAPERLENFKKRKTTNDDGESSSANTPENFTYDTPLPDIEEDDDDEIEDGAICSPDLLRGVQLPGDASTNLVGLTSQIDEEDWVNLRFGNQDEAAEDLTSSPPQTLGESHPPRPTSSSSEPWQSVSLQQLDANYRPPPEFKPLDGLAEEARINSVIWKGYREMEQLTENTPEAAGEHSPSNIVSSSGLSIALQQHTRVAELYKHLGRLTEAANVYRQVIVGYEKADGDFARQILMIAQSLAIILMAQKEYEQAEAVLIYAFCLCLQKAQADPSAAMALATGLGRPLPTQIAHVVASLEKIYSDQSDAEIKLSLAELRKALRLWNGGSLNFHYPHIWFAITRLASSYSAKGKMESARLLFKFAIPNLKSFDDILYGTKKTNSYLGYSLHLQRQQLWEKSGRILMLALENLIQLGDQGMTPRDDYEPLIELVYSRWDKLLHEMKERDVDEEMLKLMKGLIESNRAQLEHQQQSLDVAVNEMSGLEISRERSWRNSWRRLPSLTEVSEKDGYSSMSSKSYKYGVTYSGSSFTGVSDLIP